MTSTIQTFSKALVAALKLRAGLKHVAIHNGPPPMSDAQWYENVWLGDVKGDQEFTAINRTTRPKDETYSIDLVIDVIRNTKDTESTIDRAFELLAEVENCLREDPRLGLSQILYAGVGGNLELYKRADDIGRQALIFTAIEVKARI